MTSKGLAVVAGAGGFIGGHLVSALKQQGYSAVRTVDSKPLDLWYQRHEDVECVQADLRSAAACREVVSGATAVFDLAADMGGMGFIEAHKADCMLSVLIGTHLLLAARDCEVGRFFFSSSACVYNAAKQREANVVALAESDAYPALPEDGYGWEKLFMERMCRHFQEDFGLTTRIARYHNVYGPHGTWDGGREKAPAAICRKIATAVQAGSNQIEIWGDGNQTRSFMYIDDCVDGTLRIMDSEIHEPINLGSSELVSINDLVTMVEEIAGTKVSRSYDLNAPRGVRGRNSDNTLILDKLGWEPRTGLRDGLSKTYDWIFSQLAAKRREPDLRRPPNA
jgi:GDP-D-mannose 3',5'-epimerase